MMKTYIEEARNLVSDAAASDGIVNVPVIAGAIHKRHPHQPMFELEQIVLGFAELSEVPIVFESRVEPGDYQRGLLLEFITDTHDEIDDVPMLSRRASADGAGEPGE